MPDYKWPDPQHRTLIGKRTTRVDAPVKVTGHAKYTYDQTPSGLLYGKVVRCPYAHAKVVSVDTGAAEKMPGVKAVTVIQGPGKEIFWAGDEIAAVAAVDESTAEDAARAIKVEYQQLPHFVDDEKEPTNVAEATGPLSQDEFIEMLENDVPPPQVIAALEKRSISFTPQPDLIAALRQYKVDEGIIKAVQSAPVKPGEAAPPSRYKRMSDQTTGDPVTAFKEAEVVSEGLYGAPVITHCCLETHGTVCHFTDKDHLTAWVSTQGLSGVGPQFAEVMPDLQATNVRILQQYIGGGFGSKLGRPDRWGIANAELSRITGQPVKMMLERAPELEVAGARPSVFARVKIGAKKDGTVTAWESEGWSTGGMSGASQPPLPYVLNRIPNQHKRMTAVLTNIGPSRAWRAPNHPQAALVTMGAFEDLAAKLHLDPVELLLKNLNLVPRVPGPKVYQEELLKASELMGWKQHWHPRDDKTPGPVKRGLGVSMHTWGGAGHESNCDLTIQPDGSVEIKMGTQDLGTGTRTVIMVVAADTLGIPLRDINLLIGDTRYPPDGSSGGSTTVGGVSASTRHAAVDALNQLFEKVAPALNAQPADLESVNGVIRVKGKPGSSLPWKQACAKLGRNSLTVRGTHKSSDTDGLTTGGVGGVQMADVSVDTETGIVKVNKMVAVQDCGLIIDLKTAESQTYGAMIMGVSYSLYEEKIMDPISGTMLNPNMEFYRLAGYGDIPEMVVHMMTGPGYDERGVIGLGEPPVISPGAAISNAVANAIGVRVPFLPLTPDRVLAALAGTSSPERRQA